MSAASAASAAEVVRMVALGSFAAMLAAVIVASGVASVATGASDDEPATISPPGSADAAAVSTAPESAIRSPFEADEPPEIPEETPASEASESVHEDLAAGEAADLASDRFPEIVGAPGWEGIDPPPGMRVGGYIGADAAIIEPTRDPADYLPARGEPSTDFVPGGVVASPGMPLRTETEAGELRPLDTTLVRDGDAFEAKNPLVDVRMPEDLSEGVHFEGAGLGVRPAGAAGASAPEIVDGKALYANLDGAPETDFIAAPLPTATGLEFMLQLRSPDAGPAHRLSLDLPVGAALAPSAIDAGGVDVVQGGAAIASISAPHAYDSSGAEVPVEMSANGDALEIDLAHLDAGWIWPIIIDPAYDYFGWKDTANPGGYPTDISGWTTYSSHPAKFTGYFTEGLQSRSNPSTVYPSQALHEWYWTAPPNTFIERVDFYNAEHVVLPGDGQEETNFQGIWGSSGWTAGQMFTRGDASGGQGTPSDFPPNWTTPYSFSWGYDHYSFDQWVGNNRYPDWQPYVAWGPDPEGTDGNMAVFGLQMWDTGSTLRSCCARSHSRGALISLYDRYAPTLTSAPPASTGWKDDSANLNHSRTASASDVGLGMKALALHVNRTATDGSNRYYQATVSCSGNRFARCPASYQTPITYQLPEGRNTLELVPYDLVGWWQQPWQTWTERIDRSAPGLQLSGSLETAAANGQLLTNVAYDLDVTATDGSTSSPAAERSGVKSIEIQIDGVRHDYAEWTCPASSCTRNRHFFFLTNAYLAGAHTVTVMATDNTGHATAESFQVGVGGVRPASVFSLLACTAANQPANFDYYSLGSTFEGLPATRADRICDPLLAGDPARANLVSIIYGDCRVVPPQTGCTPPLEVQSWPSCERALGDYESEPGVAYQFDDLGSRRSVPAVIMDDGTRAEVYAGDTTIAIFGDDRAQLERAVGALRRESRLLPPGLPVGGTVPGGDLPLPSLAAVRGELSCGGGGP